MHKEPAAFDRLDTLLAANPPADASAEFTAIVMHHIALTQTCFPWWERPWLQWSAAGLGLVFALGRLVAFIFSAWLSVQLTG